MPDFTAPTLTPGFRDDLVQGIQNMPASKLLGLKVRGFALPGISQIELPITSPLTFDGQIVQGGIVGMLADYAGVSAAACTLPAGWMASTTGYEVHNIAPATGVRLIALGHAVHVGKSHAVSRAEVWAQTESAYTLVCVATTTCKPFELKRPST